MGRLPEHKDELLADINDVLDELMIVANVVSHPPPKIDRDDPASPYARGLRRREALEMQLARAMQHAIDEGMSVTSIWKGVPLSRASIEDFLRMLDPPAAQDPHRARRQAEQEPEYRTALRVAGLVADLRRSGRDDQAAKLRTKFVAFFREWEQAERVICADDPDALAVLDQLVKRASHALAPKELEEQVQSTYLVPRQPGWL